jgi:hypothetical protein
LRSLSLRKRVIIDKGSVEEHVRFDTLKLGTPMLIAAEGAMPIVQDGIGGLCDLCGIIGYYYGGVGLNYELHLFESLGLTVGLGSRMPELTGLPDETGLGWMIGARYYLNNPGDNFRWRIGFGVAPSFYSAFTGSFNEILYSETIMGFSYGLGFEWRIFEHFSIDVDGLGATPLKSESTYNYKGSDYKNDIPGTAFFSVGLTYHINPHKFIDYKYKSLNEMEYKWSVEESILFLSIFNDNSNGGVGVGTTVYYGLIDNLQIGLEYIYMSYNIDGERARAWYESPSPYGWSRWEYSYDAAKNNAHLISLAGRGYLPVSHCFSWILDLGVGITVNSIDYENELSFNNNSIESKIVTIKRTDIGFAAKGLVGFEWFWAEFIALKMNVGYLYAPIYQGTEDYNDDNVYDFSIDMSGITGNIGLGINF